MLPASVPSQSRSRSFGPVPFPALALLVNTSAFFTALLAFVSFSLCVAFKGILLVTLHLVSLEYADDQILFSGRADELEAMLTLLVEVGRPLGLKLGIHKCEAIAFGLSPLEFANLAPIPVGAN